MKVLLADDHVLFREGIRFVLADLAPEALEVTEVGTFAQVEAAIRRGPDFDLVLLDLHMPGADGIAGVQAVRRAAPAAPVVVLTASENPRHVRQAIEAGVRGYIAKASSSESMIEGIRKVLAGETYLSPHIEFAMRAAEEARSPAADTLLSQLTPRQVDVLSMLRKGKSNKEIGRELNLAEITVKMHVTAILRAFGVQNRTQAAILADQLGL